MEEEHSMEEGIKEKQAGFRGVQLEEEGKKPGNTDGDFARSMLEMISGTFPGKRQDIRSYSALTLAYIGDVVYGKNSKPHTTAKNATASDYLRATGFEAVLGYLYLTDNMQRALELVKKGIVLAGMEL